MRTRYAVLACLAVAGGSLLLAACGGESTTTADTGATTRAAVAGQIPDSKTCPDRSPSFDWSGSIINRLAVPVELVVGEYTCDDWSATGTPGAVMNGTTIDANRYVNVALEPRTYRNRQWTMRIQPADGGAPLGTARVFLPTSAIDPFMSTPGQGAYERSWKSAGNTITATFLPLEATGEADTPTSLLPTYSSRMGIVVHQGRVALVTEARVTG